MSAFYFGGSDSDDSGDEDALPYPKPLTRSNFLTPDFSATAFLSSLHNRHQTLEDLRVELRSRSQELNKELLDLVNDNYREFLGLGGDLKGGEEKVEEVRLGLLRFRSEVDGMKEMVSHRREEVEELFVERMKVSKEIRTGRKLLEVNERLEELEEVLRVEPNGDAAQHDGLNAEFTESDDDSDDDDQMEGTISLSRLGRRIQQFVYVTRLIDKIGPSHPFLLKQGDRVLRLRQTLLLDLNSAMKENKESGGENHGGILKVLSFYSLLEAPYAAVSAIRRQ